MIMDNQTYIHNVKMEEIIWHRLTTAYDRATAFPEYFRILEDRSNLAKKTLDTILSNIEHQDSLWRATPFSMIFLTRIFEKAATETNHVAAYLVDRLLDFFILIAELFHETEKYAEQWGHMEPLPYFSDMLKEEYLFPEECEEEEQEEIFLEEDNPSDELSYSFYYYSYQVLLEYREVFQKIDKEQADTLQDLLY